MDQLKHNIDLIFLIASRLQWMAAAAVCVNSCSPKETEQTLGGRREQCGDESYSAYEVFCNFTTLKNACRIKNHFYWKFTSVPRRISQGALQRCILSAVWAGQKQYGVLVRKVNSSRQCVFFFFQRLLMWNFWVYKLQFTAVEEPGGLRDLMEQSVWISCRIFVRLELSTVVFLSLSPSAWGLVADYSTSINHQERMLISWSERAESVWQG